VEPAPESGAIMIIKKSQAALIDFEGLSIFDYTAGKDWGSSMALIHVPPGVKHPQAYSRRSDKYYLVIDGCLKFDLDGREYWLEAGDFALVPKGSKFQYENTTDQNVSLVLVHTPSFKLEEEIFTDSP
jgi:mannose-6-phosphate isomerase-like protein (cupin superfamily)